VTLAASLVRLMDEPLDFPTPGALAAYCEPRTIRTPALDLIDAALVDAAEGRAPYLLLSMPPQEGKSQRVSRWFPLWLLLRNPDMRIAIVSYSDALARRWGRTIRNDIREHPELGLRVRGDTSAANEWQLDGYDGGVITAGTGSGLTGRPVDALLVDDAVKGQAEADSEVYRENDKDWWRGTASARLAPGAIATVTATRWHEDDLTGFLKGPENEDAAAWRLLNIPAQAEGPDDILGRVPGEYMISARGRSREEWEQRKRNAGSRAWNALYQGRPAAAEGNVFKREWWQTAVVRPVRLSDGTWSSLMDMEIVSMDAAFKDTDGSDYVVIQVWGKTGARVRLVDQVRARMDFDASVRALKGIAAKWPRAHLKLVEEKANGAAIISHLRKSVPGIVAITPRESKLARAYAVTPFIEAGNVEVPDPSWAPWVGDFLEECAGFPNAAHDDQVDTATQALDRLLGTGAGLSGFVAQLAGEKVGTEAPVRELSAFVSQLKAG
jgi:predicted phage terminase large subunit-like protein